MSNTGSDAEAEWPPSTIEIQMQKMFNFIQRDPVAGSGQCIEFDFGIEFKHGEWGIVSSHQFTSTTAFRAMCQLSGKLEAGKPFPDLRSCINWGRDTQGLALTVCQASP